LVEMEETASICSQATKNSLVILDEVGRGTSTFDGLAIAQAVVEYIATQVQARCLFATHYHELTMLQDRIPGIVSYYAASKKTPQGILFLYKVIKGVADGSFGVEVAKLAQLPDCVIERAQEILDDLSIPHVHGDLKLLAHSDDKMMANYERISGENKSLKVELKKVQQQLELQQATASMLADLDYDNLSPRQAFDLLWKIKQG
ncbi:MAG: hypothetical protein P4L31_06255, partial [Candidatus Babeliales bacterium]|nr:hypothetical protein [Candidatus Babeliales bacterium]